MQITKPPVQVTELPLRGQPSKSALPPTRLNVYPNALHRAGTPQRQQRAAPGPAGKAAGRAGAAFTCCCRAAAAATAVVRAAMSAPPRPALPRPASPRRRRWGRARRGSRPPYRRFEPAKIPGFRQKQGGVSAQRFWCQLSEPSGVRVGRAGHLDGEGATQSTGSPESPAGPLPGSERLEGTAAPRGPELRCCSRWPEELGL